MVPLEGLEPPLPCGNAILSRARLPFRHRGLPVVCHTLPAQLAVVKGAVKGAVLVYNRRSGGGFGSRDSGGAGLSAWITRMAVFSRFFFDLRTVSLRIVSLRIVSLRILPLLVAVSLLSACGGGGGGGGGGGSPAAVEPIITTPHARDITGATTQEYDGRTDYPTLSTNWRNTFAKNLPSTLGDGTTPLDGRGYTVAIVDRGFGEGALHKNLHHPESGTPIPGRKLYLSRNEGNAEEHGLNVASVIGAQGGAKFPRGVAPGASLLMVYPHQAQAPASSVRVSLRLADADKPAIFATDLYNSWTQAKADFQTFIETNIGFRTLTGTQTALRKTLRGQFFKLERVPNSQNRFRFSTELLDAFKTGGQPLVAINYSFIYPSGASMRAVLIKSAVAYQCQSATERAGVSGYYNYLTFRQIAIDLGLRGASATDPTGQDSADREQICGRVLNLSNDSDGNMNELVFDVAMTQIASFRTYVNSLMNELDKVLPDEAAKFQVQRDLVYDLGEKGAVSVVALGNEGSWRKYTGSGTNGVPVAAEFSGIFPAAFADKTRKFYPSDDAKSKKLRTFVLVVGSLQGPDLRNKEFSQIAKSEWERSFYSNACGAETKERCLFVPANYYGYFFGRKLYQGIPVLSVARDPLTNTPSNGVYTNALGTSFATPVVTGAVSLLVQYFKPGTSDYNGIKAAQDLLDTTFGLGTCAGMRGKACRVANKLDNILGHGLLDIPQALTVVQPAGTAGVATQAGSWASVARMHRRGSVLALSVPFGDTAARLRSVLNRAIVIDELGRGHRFVLGSLVSQPAATPIDSLLFAQPLAPQFSLAKTFGGDRTLRLSFAKNTSAEPSYIEGKAHKRLFASGAPIESFTKLLADAPSFSVAYESSETRAKGKNVFRLSYSGSALAGQARAQKRPDEERGGQQLLRLSGEHQLAPRDNAKPSARLRWQVALLDEESETLGGANRGVYGLSQGATSQAFSFGADQPLARGFVLSADLTSASTQAGQGGLIARWNQVRSRGWAVSLAHRSFDSRVLTGLRLSQPLRTSRGTLDLHYPARYFYGENRVEFERARVGLRPSGRELRLELAQTRTLEPWLDLETRFLYRHEPNHNRGASPEYGATLGFRIRF